MSEGSLEGEGEMPWPRAGDQLFIAASDWWMNASVNWGGGNLLIASGYQRGGDLLVETVASNRHEADALVYPIVFCYRQYLELLLKEALAEARRYFRMRERVPPIHGLLELWEPLRVLLARHSRADPDGELEQVEEQLRQFDAIDGGSYAFRYATTKAGKPSLPKDMLHINLRNLREVVERIGTYLESAIDMLDAERQAADDNYYGEP